MNRPLGIVRSTDASLGTLVVLALLATVVAPRTGVRVHHHTGGDHLHVHFEDIERHGHHGDAHPHDGADLRSTEKAAGWHALRDEAPSADGVTPAVVAACPTNDHLHAFDPFLRGMRSERMRVAVTSTTEAVDLRAVSRPPERNQIVALARGPPTPPPS